MIIIFGANGTLGDEICSSLINGKKDIILCANSGFSELEKKYVDEKYVKHILKCDVEKIINIEEIFNFLSKNNIKISAVINNFAFTFQESISLILPEGRAYINTSSTITHMYIKGIKDLFFISIILICFLKIIDTLSIRYSTAYFLMAIFLLILLIL